MNESNPKPVMIYHAPYPVGENLSSASRIRPKMMLEAFRELGYEVHEITGLPKERAQAYKQLKLRIKHGAKIEFLYSENSTQPNLFATSIRSGFAPFLEVRMFFYCSRNEIPVGQFYRDVYWRFPKKYMKGSKVRQVIMRMLYRFDLLALKIIDAHLFVPSMELGEFVPFISKSRMTELPPGLTVKSVNQPPGVNLFYVGGLGANYQLHEFIKAVRLQPELSLVLCVPRSNWDEHSREYESLLSDNIKIVHSDSDGLDQYYEQASACILMVAPSQYWDFAAPFKLYEYLGRGKPILATKNTKAGRVVEELGVGVTSEYSATEIGKVLDHLVDNPEMLNTYSTKAKDIRGNHTWKARALEVVRTLNPSALLK